MDLHSENLEPSERVGAKSFERLEQALREGSRRASITGVRGGARGYLLARLARGGIGPFVCVTADEEEAETLASDLELFLGAGTPEAPTVLRLPADSQLPYDVLSPDRRTVQARLAALFHLAHGAPARALVVSARALARRYLPAELFESRCELVGAEQQIDRDVLAARLVAMGYQSVPIVEDPGTFAVRGGILDVFSPLYGKPVRLEFFGDLVESLQIGRAHV